MEVKNGARGLDKGADLGRAGRETVTEELLVLVNETLELTLLGGDLVQGGNVELAELLNVDGAALLVSLVVELGVVFVDLDSLGVVEAVPAASVNGDGGERSMRAEDSSSPGEDWPVDAGPG